MTQSGLVQCFSLPSSTTTIRGSYRYTDGRQPNYGYPETTQPFSPDGESMLGHLNLRLLRAHFAGALLGLLLPASIALAGATGENDVYQTLIPICSD